MASLYGVCVSLSVHCRWVLKFISGGYVPFHSCGGLEFRWYGEGLSILTVVQHFPVVVREEVEKPYIKCMVLST